MAFATTETVIDVVSMSEEELDIFIVWMDGLLKNFQFRGESSIAYGLREATKIVVTPADQDNVHWEHWVHANTMIRRRIAG